jgi:hypothetical protein
MGDVAGCGDPEDPNTGEGAQDAQQRHRTYVALSRKIGDAATFLGSDSIGERQISYQTDHPRNLEAPDQPRRTSGRGRVRRPSRY